MNRIMKIYSDKLDRYDDEALSVAIDRWVICIPKAKRSRAMLKMYMIDGASYEEIAEAFDMSPRNVPERINEAMEKLIRHI